MKKSFYFLIFIILVSGTATSFCMAAEQTDPRELLAPDCSYYEKCPCGQIVNRFERDFGKHLYCKAAESSSSSSVSTASTNQQCNTPCSVRIVGYRNSDTFSAEVFCPFDKQCEFTESFLVPPLQNEFTVAELIIRAHLQNAHDITSVEFDN